MFRYDDKTINVLQELAKHIHDEDFQKNEQVQIFKRYLKNMNEVKWYQFYFFSLDRLIPEWRTESYNSTPLVNAVNVILQDQEFIKKITANKVNLDPKFTNSDAGIILFMLKIHEPPKKIERQNFEFVSIFLMNNLWVPLSHDYLYKFVMLLLITALFLTITFFCPHFIAGIGAGFMAIFILKALNALILNSIMMPIGVLLATMVYQSLKSLFPLKSCVKESLTEIPSSLPSMIKF